MYITAMLEHLPEGWEREIVERTTPGGIPISVVRVRMPVVGWIESTTDTALCFDNRRALNVEYRQVLDHYRIPYRRG